MSAKINPAAEAARLRKTIALADEAIREAADHRSARHAPGETAGESQDRWTEAARIEDAAKDCRKAARAALVRVSGLVVTAPEDLPARIEACRVYALGLKAVIEEAQRSHARRQIRIAARDLQRQITDCAAVAAAIEAERSRVEARAAEARAEAARIARIIADTGAESIGRIEAARAAWQAEEEAAAEARAAAARHMAAIARVTEIRKGGAR
jgi:colicin import membrane protein